MKYIIGNGISGLIWKYYHPEFSIIAPTPPGGLYAKSHLVWVHDAEETRTLLKKLGIPFKRKQSKIGYYVSGWILDNVNHEQNTSIIQHKMTEYGKPLNTDFKPRDKKLSLSEGSVMGTNYMNTIDVDLEEMVKRLNINIDVIDGLVTQINENKILVKKTKDQEFGVLLDYDTLVSTIAAPFFWSAWNDEEKSKSFKCLPITNIIIKQKPKEFDDKYETVYYDNSVPFSRVSHMQDKYAIEFTGYLSKEEFQKLYPDYEILEYFVVGQGRIFEVENYPPTGNIIFSGRFAQWKPGVVTENVISQAINYNESKNN